MNRKNAMSTMGYIIVLFIILGVVMIVSAPMMLNKAKDRNGLSGKDFRNESQTEYYNISEELRRVEESLSARINELENATQSSSRNSSETVQNRYICTKERSPENELEPLDGGTKKFVFVCEYSR